MGAADLVELERLPVAGPVHVVVLPPRPVPVDVPVVVGVGGDLGAVEPREGFFRLGGRSCREERLNHDDLVARPDVGVLLASGFEGPRNHRAAGVLGALEAGEGLLVHRVGGGVAGRAGRNARVPVGPRRLEVAPLGGVSVVECGGRVVDGFALGLAEPDCGEPRHVGRAADVEADAGIDVARRGVVPVDVAVVLAVDVVPRALVRPRGVALDADPVAVEGRLPGRGSLLSVGEIPRPVVCDDAVVAACGRVVTRVALAATVVLVDGGVDERVEGVVVGSVELDVVLHEERGLVRGDQHVLIEVGPVAAVELEPVVDVDFRDRTRLVGDFAPGGVVANVEGLAEVGVPEHRVHVPDVFHVAPEGRGVLDECAVPVVAFDAGVLVERRQHVLARAIGSAHDGVLVAVRIVFARRGGRRDAPQEGAPGGRPADAFQNCPSAESVVICHVARIVLDTSL